LSRSYKLGIALAKLRAQGYYKDLGFKSIRAYLLNLSDTSSYDFTSLKRWLRIGEAYVKYKDELEKIGFTASDGSTKLNYLERALAIHKKEEVFRHIKTMTFRDFYDYSNTLSPDSEGKRLSWKSAGILYTWKAAGP
jgi:hypothetical protein